MFVSFIAQMQRCNVTESQTLDCLHVMKRLLFEKKSGMQVAKKCGEVTMERDHDTLPSR